MRRVLPSLTSLGRLQTRLAVLAGLAAFAMVSADGVTTLTARHAAIDGAWLENANLARALADQTHGVFANTQTILFGLREHLENDGTSAPSLQRLRRLMRLSGLGTSALNSISVTDAAGHVIAISDNAASAPTDLSTFPCFSHHQASPDRAVFFGWPVTNPRDGSRVLTLSVRLDAPDGSFAGVAVASLAIGVFENALATFHVGDGGVLALLRTDGVLIARAPAGGDTVAPPPIHPEAAAGERPLLALATTQAGARLDSYVWLPSEPLVVLVGRDKSSVLAVWRITLIEHAVGLLLVMGMLGLLTLRLFRSIGESERGRRLLEVSNAQLALSEARTARANRWLEMAEQVAQVGHWHLSLAGARQLIWSDELYRIHGLDKENFDLTPQSAVEVFHPEDQGRVEHALDLLIATGTPFEIVARILRTDGQLRYVLARGLRQEADGGTPTSVFGVVLDVTDQKQSEAALLQANAAAEAANEALEAANHALEALALQDALTGLSNRRHFDRALDHEFRRAVRAGQVLGLILIDVDHFKQFNDTYGHQAGDACLRAIAGTIPPLVNRPGDIAARYGGEEIALLLPGTGLAGAMALAARIAQAVRDLAIPHTGNGPGVVTVSAGVEAIVPARDTDSPALLLEHADIALYAAKHGGRDQVCSYAETQTPRLVRA